jgi:hypothetical protein
MQTDVMQAGMSEQGLEGAVDIARFARAEAGTTEALPTKAKVPTTWCPTALARVKTGHEPLTNTYNNLLSRSRPPGYLFTAVVGR